MGNRLLGFLQGARDRGAHLGHRDDLLFTRRDGRNTAHRGRRFFLRLIGKNIALDDAPPGTGAGDFVERNVGVRRDPPRERGDAKVFVTVPVRSGFGGCRFKVLPGGTMQIIGGIVDFTGTGLLKRRDGR